MVFDFFACGLAVRRASVASAYSGSGQKVRHYTIGGAGDCKAGPGVPRYALSGGWRAREGESADEMVLATFQKYRIEMDAFLYFQ
jgi:hypothetical protein